MPKLCKALISGQHSNYGHTLIKYFVCCNFNVVSMAEMPTSGDLKSGDSLFTTPHPLPRNSMNPCPPPHPLKIWE